MRQKLFQLLDCLRMKRLPQESLSTLIMHVRRRCPRHPPHIAPKESLSFLGLFCLGKLHPKLLQRFSSFRQLILSKITRCQPQPCLRDLRVLIIDIDGLDEPGHCLGTTGRLIPRFPGTECHLIEQIGVGNRLRHSLKHAGRLLGIP